MPTKNQTAEETPQKSRVNKLAKYGPLLLIVILVAGLAGYRMYQEKEDSTEVLVTEVDVTQDANAVSIPVGMFRSRQIDLAHLEVPASACFRARFYLMDIIGDREVSLEMIDDSSCILIVPDGDVNYALVRYGLAKAEGSYYQSAEDKAKKYSLGIWKTHLERSE